MCRSVFSVPDTEHHPPVVDTPDPDCLPFTPEDVSSALEHGFKPNKSSGTSPLPTQVLKYLAKESHPALSEFFNSVATTTVPDAWCTVAVTPVYKGKDSSDPGNYRPVSVMGPLPKLFMSCLTRYLDSVSELAGWPAPTQAGFRRKHRLEDLVVAVDYLLDRAAALRTPLVLTFVDITKAFDSVPRA